MTPKGLSVELVYIKNQSSFLYLVIIKQIVVCERRFNYFRFPEYLEYILNRILFGINLKYGRSINFCVWSLA